jgi:hypothetical protein
MRREQLKMQLTRTGNTVKERDFFYPTDFEKWDFLQIFWSENIPAVLVDCNENPIYVFPEKELRGLRPKFHIHVSVSDLYIPRISQHIFL